MANLGKTICHICGAPVGQGCRFCSLFCKLTFENDQALAKHKVKSKKKTSKKKASTKKVKKGK